MRTKAIALAFGAGFGFVISWAQVTDPMAIRRMLLLQEPDLFLLMGSAIVVAAAGIRLLRARRATAIVTRERVAWTLASPAPRHVIGSVVFGVGWAIAGTCPGPMAAMIGQGRLGGMFVAGGVVAGIALERAVRRRGLSNAPTREDSSVACV